jgi:hypothetical protein
MWILIVLLPFSLLGLVSCIVLGGPRRYTLLSGVFGLVLLWGWLTVSWWTALLWLVSYGGLRLLLITDYTRRRRQTETGVTGGARYLSFLPHDKTRQGLVLWLPPLKAPLYWAVTRMKRPLPAAGGGQAGQMLLPVLNQIFGQSRGFRIDTRHLPGQAGPAMEIRCD